MRSLRTRAALVTAVVTATAATLLVPGSSGATATAATDPNIVDVCENRRPEPADPGAYGMQLDGSFRHPALTPVDEEHEHSFPGRNKDYDTKSYIKNMRVEAAYEGADFTPDFFHTWQNVVDFHGRRYLFQYDRSEGRVYDITDVKKVKVVEKMTRDDIGGDETKGNASWAPGDYWGASTVQWNKKLNAYVMVMSFEDKRQITELTDDPAQDKYHNREGVRKLREKPGLKGFKVFRLDGPLKKDWKLLATVSTDATQKDPLRSDPAKPQQGSGSLDVPYWTGDRYMFIATAPDDTYSGTEYPTNLHSAGYQSWDMSDPAHPRLLDTWHLPGQRTGEDAAYRKNPRCGNRTSWMGARMPLFIPKPVEKGGRYAFAAMGGYGLSVLDISDPTHMRTVGHLDLPASVSGTEGDNIDVSQFERTGIIYYSGTRSPRTATSRTRTSTRSTSRTRRTRASSASCPARPRPGPPASRTSASVVAASAPSAPATTRTRVSTTRASSATASTTRGCSSSTCRIRRSPGSRRTSCRRRTARRLRTTRTATRPTACTWNGTATSPGP
ncbi:hypothetical protein [Streptomyces sp. NPDC050145]|uniref:hypothetical protein n=1 Tax=Streptomyces sp. NPDC050145 TaxID=3365602 RepID=UPI0037AB5CE2